MPIYFLQNDDGKVLDYEYMTSLEAREKNKYRAHEAWKTSKQIVQEYKDSQSLKNPA